MTEKTKNGSHKRGRISEEDISVVLERYTATTVLALLQEVGQLEGAKIDWNAIVKNTSTGICSVRECQMLWRHLAYRHSLSDKLDDGAQPQGDDSDLEYELEAYPEVSCEASAEAAACVKVLMASGLPTDSNQTNAGTVEAPLTINIPNSHSLRATSENSQPAAMRGMNITIPVFVQKQPAPLVAALEGMDINGSQIGNNQSKRKRKPWSESEDLELIAAVRKFGEGNWANIVKGEFKGDRTPSQLSQRWGVIRRKNSSNLKQLTNSNDSLLSEAQRAARHAMNMALDPHTRPSFMNNNTGGGKNFGIAKVMLPVSSNESLVVVKQELSRKRPAVTRFSLIDSAASKGAAAPPAKPNLTSDPVRAAAVAAGARIASQSDAASLLKAAQANNAVHIMAKPGPPARPAVLSGLSTHSEARLKVNQPPLSMSPSGPRKNASPSIVQRPPTSMKMSSVRSRKELPQVGDGKTVGCGIKVCSSSPEAAGKAKVQKEDGGHGEQVSNNDRTASGNKEVKQNDQTPVVGHPGALVSKKENVGNGKVDALGNRPEESRKDDERNNKGTCSSSKEGEKQQHLTQAIKEKSENKRMNKQQQQQQDVRKTVGGHGCSEKLEKVGEAGEGAVNKVQAGKDGERVEERSS